MKDLDPSPVVVGLDETLKGVFNKIISREKQKPRDPLDAFATSAPREDSLLGELRDDATDWSFRMPQRTNNVEFQFKRVVNETDLSILERVHFGDTGKNERSAHGKTAAETMDYLSTTLTKLRNHVFSTAVQDRNSSLYYATVMFNLCNACHNTVVPFAYDDYQTDNLLVEYVHALMAALARVNERALQLGGEWNDLEASCDEMNGPFPSPMHRTLAIQTTNVWRQRARYFTFCIELLQAMFEACTRARQLASQQENDRFLYVLSPDNLSSSQQGFDREAAVAETLERDARRLLDFVENGLGGERQIVAHIHHMLARRNEAHYHDMTAQVNRSGDDGEAMQLLPPIMQSIVSEYRKARQDARCLSDRSAFYRHMRFRAHYWHCALHLAVARLESKKFMKRLLSGAVDETNRDAGLDNAQCALIRLHHITGVTKSFAARWPTLRDDLNKPLRAEYDSLLLSISALYEQLDQEIYVTRRLAPTGLFEQLPSIEDHVYEPIDRILQQMMNALFNNEKRRILSDAVLLIQTINQQYHAELGDTPPQPQPQQPIDELPQEQPQVEQIGGLPILARSNDCKIELLKDRRNCILWMLSFFGEEQDERRLTVDAAWLYELLQRELPKVTERLEMERK